MQRFYLKHIFRHTLNCTFWNWNSLLSSVRFFIFSSLNCTFWNWNYPPSVQSFRLTPLNCTFWNWNPFAFATAWQVVPTLNCTFWNWNFAITFELMNATTLWIVPFGIEIQIYFSAHFSFWAFELYLLELKFFF